MQVAEVDAALAAYGSVAGPVPRLRSAAFISPRLSRSDRPMLRAQRMRGSDDGMGEPDKPNGMHWATYNRLLDRADELDDRGWMSALGGILSSAG